MERPQAKQRGGEGGVGVEAVAGGGFGAGVDGDAALEAAFVRGGDAGEDELGGDQRGSEARCAVDPARGASPAGRG